LICSIYSEAERATYLACFALTNLILVRLGYPPAIIQKRERERYLDALARADREDPGPLGELFARAVIDNLTRFVVPAIAGPARLVPLEALATQELSGQRHRRPAQGAPNPGCRDSSREPRRHLPDLPPAHRAGSRYVRSGGPRWTRTTCLRVISTALYLMS
jgi:hypothetical protein